MLSITIIGPWDGWSRAVLSFALTFCYINGGPFLTTQSSSTSDSPYFTDLTCLPSRFAVVVIPVYEDPADKESSPFRLLNSEPFSWSWLSTINRVNSQVQKVCSFLIYMLDFQKTTYFQERTRTDNNMIVDINPDLCDDTLTITAISKSPSLPCLPCSLLRQRSSRTEVHPSSHARLTSKLMARPE